MTFRFNPPPNAPLPGYRDNLKSDVFDVVVFALIDRMKKSGYLNHVSTYFPGIRLSLMDEEYPTIMVDLPNGDEISSTINQRKIEQLIDIFYYSKGLTEPAFAFTEINNFIESIYKIINKDHSLTLKNGACIRIKGIVNHETDHFVLDDSTIAMGRVSLMVDIPICTMPLDDVQEETT
jgi:hypothetical protein